MQRQEQYLFLHAKSGKSGKAQDICLINSTLSLKLDLPRLMHLKQPLGEDEKGGESSFPQAQARVGGEI